MADETGNHEETQNTRVSRREAFGLGPADLAATLAVAGTKQASGAPQTLKPTAADNAPNAIDPGPQNLPLAAENPDSEWTPPTDQWHCAAL